MTEINPQELKKNFHQDIIDLYKKITKMVKYKPTRLMDYINKYGGYEAAVKYISTESNVQDFAVLWEKERLDLSVEALITCEKYRSLFNEDVVAFCDRKLKEYSYAPNKIEEVKETSGYIDEEEDIDINKIDVEEFLRQKELMMPKIIKKDFKIYKYAVGISKEEWKTILLDARVVTASNLDFIMRVYCIGDEVGPLELGKEKGLSSKYPYKEVMMALGKRIKTALNVEVPVGEDQKPLWWHLLFNGGFKDNSTFEWSLKNELREAIDELIAEGKVEKVEVDSEKPLHPVAEEAVKKKLTISTPEEEISAFDRLFASIMSDESPKQESVAESKPAASAVVTAKTVAPVTMTREVVREAIHETEKAAKSVETVETAPAVKLAQVAHEAHAEMKVAADTQPAAIASSKSAGSALDILETLEAHEAVADQLAAPKAKMSTEKTHEETLKEACIEYYGAICDLCGFDYGYTYGEAFEGMIQVHNIHAQDETEILPDTDPVKDLIPVCHNCHQVIHSQTPPIAIEKMREIIKA